MNSIEALRKFVSQLKSGSLSPQRQRQAEGLLCDCWDSLADPHEGGMKGEKLVGRTEKMSWEPPVLDFFIERHGAIVGGGSSRAELQHWDIDVEKARAVMCASSFRQNTPMDRALKVNPIAVEIATLILQRHDDERLRWKSADEVKVDIGEVIPSTNKQTTSARRKRFTAALEAQLAGAGWLRKNAGTQLIFHRSPSA